MIHLPASVRVYLCLTPTDMRRSFDGLHALVRDDLQLDAFAGHLYLFANRRKDRLKLLYSDRDGFAIWAKRLEQGSYTIPSGEPVAAVRDRKWSWLSRPFFARNKLWIGASDLSGATAAAPAIPALESALGFHRWRALSSAQVH